MDTASEWVVVGIDNGGNSNNATILDGSGRFLVDRLVETPSRVTEGPEVAIEAMAKAVDNVLDLTGLALEAVRGVGLDTPGPASADGVISSKGATNFAQPAWRGFDVRGALEGRLGLPVVYNNDANAAALYAHHVRFGDKAAGHSSVSVIVGTGLGGGVIEAGRVVKGVAGMAGELGHVQIPTHGLLAEGQPLPTCNCGFVGDAESFASLTGIEKNLLPYWLTRFENHEL
ncbi:MAG TPA: ROK family protein, partial [Actinomycetes bacterium]|nr:ROK family protein [Actinomycetes bacterium]